MPIRNSRLIPAVIMCAQLLAGPAFAREGAPDSFCKGYRYVYIESPMESSNLASVSACRIIQEPSSRPVGCKEVAKVDMSSVTAAGKMALSNFKLGVSLGVACSLAVYTIPFFNSLASAGLRVVNKVAWKSTEQTLADEVNSGRRMPGERSGTPKYSVCKLLGGNKDTEFSRGVQMGYFSLETRALALKTDAGHVRRHGDLEGFYRRAGKVTDEDTQAILKTMSAIRNSKELWKMMMETMAGIPMGTSSDIAIVDAKNCIKEEDLDKIRKFVGLYAEAVAATKP